MKKFSTPVMISAKLGGSYEIEYFQNGPRVQNNSATWLMRLCFKSSEMDTWYLVSLVTHLIWPGFLEIFLLPVAYNDLKWN